MTRKEKEAAIKRTIGEALDEYGVHARDILVKLVLTELEAAGKQWDPEELAIQAFAGPRDMHRIGRLDSTAMFPFTEFEAQEIIRRFEALPRIEKAFRRWQAAEYGDCFEDDFFAHAVEGVLGKDGSS